MSDRCAICNSNAVELFACGPRLWCAYCRMSNGFAPDEATAILFARMMNTLEQRLRETPVKNS